MPQNSGTKGNHYDHRGTEKQNRRLIIPKPNSDKPYKLGDAKIYVVDVCAEDENDSLVLLINHNKTNFIFTGDIEKKAQRRVAASLREMEHMLEGGENLIKMPHHGAYNSDTFLPDNAYDNSLGTLLSASYAKYFVISVGKNTYSHPHPNTLKLIAKVLKTHNLNRDECFFRTDMDGDIVATSNGETITIEPCPQP